MKWNLWFCSSKNSWCSWRSFSNLSKDNKTNSWSWEGRDFDHKLNLKSCSIRNSFSNFWKKKKTFLFCDTLLGKFLEFVVSSIRKHLWYFYVLEDQLVPFISSVSGSLNLIINSIPKLFQTLDVSNYNTLTISYSNNSLVSKLNPILDFLAGTDLGWNTANHRAQNLINKHITNINLGAHLRRNVTLVYQIWHWM